jgi:hypothetical protein
MKNTDQSSSPKPRGSVAVLLACVLAGGLLAAQAQTTIPASLKAPPGSYNTANKGFLVRAHQITTARTPGDENSIVNVERQLKGEFGAGIATNGPSSGYYTSEVIDFDVSRITPDLGGIGPYSYPFPGVDLDDLTPSANYNPSNIAVEVIGFLDLPATNIILTLRSDDSVRLTIGIGDNPYDYMALQPAGAVYNGTRTPDNSTFTLAVTNAGVYPIRIVYGQGSGGGTLEFCASYDFFGSPMTNLVNDPNAMGYVPASYLPASLPIAPAKAYVRYLNPLPGEANSQALPTITAELKDAGTTVVQSSVLLRVDGDAVVPAVVKANGVTTVTYTPGALLSSGAHSAQVIFQDSAANWSTNTWSFSVATYRFVAIPASWSYPVASKNTSEPGFLGLSKICRTGAIFSTTVANGDANLADTLIDPQTGLPYVNLAANTTNELSGAPLQWGVNWFGYMLVQPGGTFVETNVVNYATDGVGAVPLANYGNIYTGYAETNYPGAPGADDTNYANYANIYSSAIELRGFVHLPAGLQVIGVHCRDAFQLAFQANDARDIFRVSLTQNDVNGGGYNFPVILDVAQEGLYSFRLMQQRYISENPAGLEFWTAPFTNQTDRTLVNASSGVKVYRSVTVPTRPYIKSVTPVFGETGVATNTSITATFANLGSDVPVMKVN